MAVTKELFPGPFDLLPPIFRDCIDEDTLRFCLAYPQPVGGYVCATDARIYIRMPLTPEIGATLPSIAPKKFPESGLAMFTSRTDWEAASTPLPSLDHLERCPECKGEGYRPRRRCTGACDFDELSPCRGKGIIPAGTCYDCDGTGIDDPGQEVLEFRKDIKLSARYLHILIKHKATLYLPVEPNTWESVRAVYFTVEGGVDGLLMPIALDKPAKAEMEVAR